MRYFILYTSSKYGFKENYLKGESFKEMEDKIQKFSNGRICTNKSSLYTYNIPLGFLREINLNFHPELSETDFEVINENKCYDFSKFEDMDF